MRNKFEQVGDVVERVHHLARDRPVIESVLDVCRGLRHSAQTSADLLHPVQNMQQLGNLMPVWLRFLLLTLPTPWTIMTQYVRNPTSVVGEVLVVAIRPQNSVSNIGLLKRTRMS